MEHCEEQQATLPKQQNRLGWTRTGTTAGLFTKQKILSFFFLFALFKLVLMQSHDDFDFVGLNDQHSSSAHPQVWWKRLIWESFILCVYAFVWVAIHMAIYHYAPMPVGITRIRNVHDQMEEYNSYISYLPALLHAPVATVVGLYGFYCYPNKYGEPAQGWQWFPSYYSASFFIHDGIIGWYHGYLDPLMQAHHILMVIVVIWGIIVGDGYGKDLCYGIAWGEITNPLYSIHMILEWHEFPDPIVQGFGVVFIFAFFIARAVLMPIEVYRFQLGESDLLFKLTYTGMWVISMLLVWRMLNKVSKMCHKVSCKSLSDR